MNSFASSASSPLAIQVSPIIAPQHHAPGVPAVFQPNALKCVLSDMIGQMIRTMAAAKGFTALDANALEALEEIFVQHFSSLCVESAKYAEHAGRSQTMIPDVIVAASNHGLNWFLFKYWILMRQDEEGNVKLTKPAEPPIQTPMPPLSLGLTVKRDPRIPDWYPPLPEKQYFQHTFQPPSNERGYMQCRLAARDNHMTARTALVSYRREINDMRVRNKEKMWLMECENRRKRGILQMPGKPLPFTFNVLVGVPKHEEKTFTVLPLANENPTNITKPITHGGVRCVYQSENIVAEFEKKFKESSEKDLETRKDTESAIQEQMGQKNEDFVFVDDIPGTIYMEEATETQPAYPYLSGKKVPGTANPAAKVPIDDNEEDEVLPFGGAAKLDEKFIKGAMKFKKSMSKKKKVSSDDEDEATSKEADTSQPVKKARRKPAPRRRVKKSESADDSADFLDDSTEVL